MSVANYLKRTVADRNKDVIKRSCSLVPKVAGNKTINLVSGKNVIGRSRKTGIQDSHCSKHQLQLDVNLAEASVQLRVLGLNASTVNGLMVMNNTSVQICHGDIIEIVYGRHIYEVVFKPPPDSETNSTTSSNEAASTSAGATDSANWDVIDNEKLAIYTSAGVAASEKIAAYDIDGTIITTKSGNVFPKTTADWQIIFSEVAPKLKRLHEDGYKICFFTNQAAIGTGRTKLSDFKQKIKGIVQRLGIPVQVFIATTEGYYRKPMCGMWEHLEKEKNNGIEIKKEKCFYVGDAAGRPEIGSGVGKKRKDHSLADRLFATNVGISFYTPEEHFLGKRTEQWNKPEFDPSSVHERIPLIEPESTNLTANKCEMIIIVGLPGSGKSHFCKENLLPLGYTIANSDTLGSVNACLTACERALSNGTPCAVDNTNVDKEARKKFLEVANKHNVQARCFVMNVTLTQARHNNTFRQLTGEKHSKINDMVFNMMKKKYVAPKLEEGFSEIAKVNFKPKFNNNEEERLYKMYLLEK